MATYNGEKYIAQQIDSILACMKKDDELIIADDGSTDDTGEILKKYAHADSRIKALFTDVNLGVIKNFERALSEARGEIIFLSDQDDIWFPEKMESVLSVFRSSSSISCVLHDLTVVNQNLDVLAPSFFELRKSKPGVIRNMVKNSFIGSAMAFDSKLLELILPIPDTVPMHDQWIGTICGCVGEVRFLNSKLGLYRRHESNVTEMTHGSISDMFKKRYRLIYHFIRRHKRIESFKRAFGSTD